MINHLEADIKQQQIFIIALKHGGGFRETSHWIIFIKYSIIYPFAYIVYISLSLSLICECRVSVITYRNDRHNRRLFQNYGSSILRETNWSNVHFTLSKWSSDSSQAPQPIVKFVSLSTLTWSVNCCEDNWALEPDLTHDGRCLSPELDILN